jgi:CheY-like chemotaxis protein
MMRSPEQIVIVEDCEHDRELALHVLRGAGITADITVLCDGVEAVEYFGHNGSADSSTPPNLPRLVLLDLKLPRLSGIEVLQRIRECPATRHVPVVAFTSSQDPSDVRAAYEAGVNSYVVKPIEFDQFAETVTALATYWLHQNVDTTTSGTVV